MFQHVYEGLRTNGDINGHGRLIYFGGAHYIGNWKDEERHGYGTLVKLNGDVFTGNWVKGNLLVVPKGMGIIEEGEEED